MEADGLEQMRNCPLHTTFSTTWERNKTSSIYESKYNLESKKEDHRGLVHCRIYTTPTKKWSEIWVCAKYGFQIMVAYIANELKSSSSQRWRDLLVFAPCSKRPSTGLSCIWPLYHPCSYQPNSACQETSVPSTHSCPNVIFDKLALCFCVW